MIARDRVAPDPETVRRQLEVYDLYGAWPSEGDPDDDPAYVARVREIMGLPPLPRDLD